MSNNPHVTRRVECSGNGPKHATQTDVAPQTSQQSMVNAASTKCKRRLADPRRKTPPKRELTAPSKNNTQRSTPKEAQTEAEAPPPRGRCLTTKRTRTTQRRQQLNATSGGGALLLQPPRASAPETARTSLKHPRCAPAGTASRRVSAVKQTASKYMARHALLATGRMRCPNERPPLTTRPEPPGNNKIALHRT